MASLIKRNYNILRMNWYGMRNQFCVEHCPVVLPFITFPCFLPQILLKNSHQSDEYNITRMIIWCQYLWSTIINQFWYLFYRFTVRPIFRWIYAPIYWQHATTLKVSPYVYFKKKMGGKLINVIILNMQTHA